MILNPAEFFKRNIVAGPVTLLWLEIWAVQRGRPYDVFEVPPHPASDERTAMEKELVKYPSIDSLTSLSRYGGIGVQENLFALFLAGINKIDATVNAPDTGDRQRVPRQHGCPGAAQRCEARGCDLAQEPAE